MLEIVGSYALLFIFLNTFTKEKINTFNKLLILNKGFDGNTALHSIIWFCPKAYH